MPIVSARGVSKSYGPQTLFEDVSLTIRRGERVGLLGANGTGKSTLLRVVAGLEAADTGTVERRRDASVRYLSQEPVLDPEATPRQIVERGLAAWHGATRRHAELTHAIESRGGAQALLDEQAALAEAIDHLGGWARDHVALEMLQHLGVRDLDRAVGTMSGGERRRVALAELLVAEPALAILDEPTNHLDTETIEWLEEYLADTFAGSVLIVTHDRYVLDAVADRVLELDQGRVREFQGGYGDYLEQKAELVAHAERVEQNRLNLLRRERAWLLRGAKARTTKQKARVQRARALLAARGLEEAPEVRLEGLGVAPRMGKTILDLVDLDVAVGGRTLIRGLTLRLLAGERLGVVGPNGAGKTSLLRIVSGELAPSGGQVVRGVNTRSVTFDQSRSQLMDDWSIFDNVAEREGALQGGADVVRLGDRTLELRTYLEQFLFDAGKQRQKVGALSGGERARVALAKVLKTGANLLLLDEPTNDLDVATLGALEELLSAWPGSAIVVSHDRYFLDRVATSTLMFEGDGETVRYEGGYGSARALREQGRAERATATVAVGIAPQALGAEPPAVPGASAPKPLTFAERKELEGILDEISSLEAAVSELEARLADPALYGRSPEEARRVRADHESAAARLAGRTSRWEELEGRRDVKRR